MAYNKTVWKDRVVSRPRTYIETSNADGSITHTPSEGTISETGTPVNAINLNKIETELAEKSTRLDTESLAAVTLSAGRQILNATKNARLQGLKVQGRTLMPLLSDSFKTDSNSDGMADGWAAVLYGATPSLVSINGGKAQRITSTAADTGTPRRLERNITVESGKRYVALVDVVTDGTSLAYLAAASGTSTITNASSVTSAATKTHSVKFMPTTSGTIILRLYNYNGLGTVGWVQFDSLRVIEVSASDYTSFDSMTSDQIAQRWPFVPPGINGVDGLWVKRYGRNLIPPFSDQAWVLHVYAKVAEPYKLIANPTGSSQRSNITLNVIPGQRYTFSQGDVASTVTYFLIVDTNSTGTILSSTNGVTSTSFTAPASGIIYIATTNSTTGSFGYSNPQLELGNTATPFQPREDSLIAFGGVELHANPTDGSEPDILREVNGRYEVTRLWRELIADGTLLWEYHGTATGYKVVKLPKLAATFAGDNRLIGFVTKYNGISLVNTPSSVNVFAAGADTYRQLTSDANFYLNIASSDSGWGDSYTPSADEIKAYFNGWKMYDGSAADVNTTRNTPYTTGQKFWRNQDNTVWGYTTIPSTSAPGWQPYQLLYRLASVTTDQVQEDGSLSLLEGDNFIEVGSGYVSRERAMPFGGAAYGNLWYINSSFAGFEQSRLKNKAQAILSVFKNGLIDQSWVIDTLDAYGLQRVKTQIFDPSASYSVSYIKLDKSPVPGVTGFYAASEKAQLRDLTDGVNEALARVSVVEAKKAEKDAPAWITPTLLNGATNVGNGEFVAQYYKDSSSIVSLRGLINATALSLALFKLPEGYRPASTMRFAVSNSSGVGVVVLYGDGTVAIFNGAITSVDLSVIKFKAEL